VEAPFDDLISTLEDKDCDAIMSSMTVTPERSERVAFVEYMIAGAGPDDATQETGTADLRLGIAVRPADDELRDAIQDSIDDMYADDTMVKLLEQWDAADYVLPDPA
jgi:ABC-type amino acid transport substrate-binding protein